MYSGTCLIRHQETKEMCRHRMSENSRCQIGQYPLYHELCKGYIKLWNGNFSNSGRCGRDRMVVGFTTT